MVGWWGGCVVDGLVGGVTDDWVGEFGLGWGAPLLGVIAA